MFMNKEEIIKFLTDKGVVLKGDESPEVLAALYADSTDKSETPVVTASDNGNPEKINGKVLWLKSTAYVSDTQRLDAGLYVMDKIPQRLVSLPSDIVEVFSGKVPSKRIAQIARWAGIDPDGMKDVEILQKVVNTEVRFY